MPYTSHNPGPKPVAMYYVVNTTGSSGDYIGVVLHMDDDPERASRILQSLPPATFGTYPYAVYEIFPQHIGGHRLLDGRLFRRD